MTFKDGDVLARDLGDTPFINELVVPDKGYFTSAIILKIKRSIKDNFFP